jgi:hypothetical protein
MFNTADGLEANSIGNRFAEKANINSWNANSVYADIQ